MQLIERDTLGTDLSYFRSTQMQKAFNFNYKSDYSTPTKHLGFFYDGQTISPDRKTEILHKGTNSC